MYRLPSPPVGQSAPLRFGNSFAALVFKTGRISVRREKYDWGVLPIRSTLHRKSSILEKNPISRVVGKNYKHYSVTSQIIFIDGIHMKTGKHLTI